MIQLKRVVNIKCFEAQATVAVGRERPEFLAVAQLAYDLDRPINGQDILDELLGNCLMPWVGKSSSAVSISACWKV